MTPLQALFFPPDPTDGNWQYLADRWARLPFYEPQLSTQVVTATFSAGSWEDFGDPIIWRKDESWSSVMFDWRAAVDVAGDWRLVHSGASADYITILPPSPFYSALAIESLPLPSGLYSTQIQADADISASSVTTQLLISECIPTPSIQ